MTRELIQPDLFGGPDVDLTKWPTPTDQSHLAKVFRRLKGGRPLTALEALEDLGCSRLAARVWDLQLMGIAIATTRVLENGRFVVAYQLEEDLRES